MAKETLMELYVEQLRDLYNAEQQILKAMPKMITAASHPELKRALEEHEAVTRDQVGRLEQIFEQLGQRSGGHVCKGMQGVLAEGDEAMTKHKDSDVLDAALIASAQRVEHYEMAGYGCARTYANTLGFPEHADLLQRTLDEEGEADHRLTDLAESIINIDALKG